VQVSRIGFGAPPTSWTRSSKGPSRLIFPSEQPTKFALVINMKTANALGITIPEAILLHADEVIR
jgi:putative ABC transport system substrate-binding protein